MKKESHLIIAGDGPLYKTLAAQKHPNIAFTGFLEGEELAKLYATSTLLTHPELRSSFRSAARQFAMGQSWDSIFNTLIKSYFETQGKSSSRTA